MLVQSAFVNSKIIRNKDFTAFENSRQFSCYAGMAPFDDSLGTSRNRGRHIRRTGSNRYI
ncbi:MAG: IS110 family transposase [Tannerella sp.]|nr:IS110 family transposase [Tannerella sp.]